MEICLLSYDELQRGLVLSFQDYLDYRKTAANKKITEHFTLFDIINSNTAIVKKIDNRPTTQIIANATLLIKNVLEPLRIHFNSPLNVNCMYRSTELNKAVGGVATSQHCTGQAADITIANHTIEEIFNYIKHSMIFDQVIQENTWIHVSFNPVHNRKQSLRLVNGKYIAA